MLQSIPWLVLCPILATPAPSIRAFTESVFLYAITTERHQVVKDLLHLDFIRATVVSNGAALVAAVRTSSCKLVNLILDAEACPKKTDYRNRLPLTETSNVDVAKLLLKAGADINAKGHISLEYDAIRSVYGPAVVAATASGNIDLVQFLIGKRANLNTYAHRGLWRYSLAMVAVCCGSVDILHMLLQAGSRPNEISETLHGELTPLQKAAELRDIKTARLLIKYGGDANAPAYGERGMTALQAAVLQEDIEMVKVLLANGADVNIPNENDDRFPQSLLTAAVERNNLELVRTILDAGADLNVPSFGYYGCTAPESAMCLPGGSDICDLLVAGGAQHDARPNNEYTQIQLRRAVWKGDLARIMVLLRTGLRIDVDPYDDSPYRDIYCDERPERRSILQHGIVRGSAIFHLLFDIIKNYGEDIDFHPLLVEAARTSNVEIQRKLLDSGANINSTHCRAGELNGTPLMFAVWKNDLEAVRFLHDKGADINIVVEGFHVQEARDATTALQISLWRAGFGLGYLDVYYFLRHHGATINAPIARVWGLSELASAVMSKDLAIVQELLDTGANVNSPPAEIGGRTALQTAAELCPGNPDMIYLLLQRGADVNAPPACRYGITALRAAARQGHFQVALILLKAGADVNAKFEDPFTSTPLRDAASYGRLDTVYLLLKAGADLHLPKHERYVEATEAARQRGHIAIATILENWKVNEGLERSLCITVSQNQGESLVTELD
jgi:ankyrin repeat protein